MKKLLFFSMILSLSISCSKKETITPSADDLASNQKMIDIAEKSGQSFIDALEYVGSQLILDRSTQEEINTVIAEYLNEDLITNEDQPSQTMSEWLQENRNSLDDEDFQIYSNLNTLLEMNFIEDEVSFLDDLENLQQQVLKSHSDRKLQFLVSLSTIKHLVKFTKEALNNTDHSYHAYLFQNNLRIDVCQALKLIAAQVAYNDCLSNGQFGSEETAQSVCQGQGLYAYHNYKC